MHRPSIWVKDRTASSCHCVSTRHLSTLQHVRLDCDPSVRMPQCPVLCCNTRRTATTWNKHSGTQPNSMEGCSSPGSNLHPNSGCFADRPWAGRGTSPGGVCKRGKRPVGRHGACAAPGDGAVADCTWPARGEAALDKTAGTTSRKSDVAARTPGPWASCAASKTASMRLEIRRDHTSLAGPGTDWRACDRGWGVESEDAAVASSVAWRCVAVGAGGVGGAWGRRRDAERGAGEWP
jgi:hypothetical protein